MVNPTTADLEETVAKLEGGAGALATGSGVGAIAPTILTFVESGGRVVAGKSPSTATVEILEDLDDLFEEFDQALWRARR